MGAGVTEGAPDDVTRAASGDADGEAALAEASLGAMPDDDTEGSRPGISSGSDQTASGGGFGAAGADAGVQTGAKIIVFVLYVQSRIA